LIYVITWFLAQSMHASYNQFISSGHGKFGPWFDLVNSEEWDTFGRFTEHFDNPAWLPFFLRRWQFAKPPGRPVPLAKLRKLRAAIRGMCQAAVGRKPIPAADLHTLNEALNVPGKRELRQRQNGLRLEFVSTVSGWDLILAETAGSFADLLAAGDLSRIKICRNPGCRWVFYDKTRARTHCWCDDKVCGNRERVRRARAKIGD
jgi:predicted RNA-binding Zn ribbon-like protein